MGRVGITFGDYGLISDDGPYAGHMLPIPNLNSQCQWQWQHPMCHKRMDEGQYGA